MMVHLEMKNHVVPLGYNERTHADEYNVQMDCGNVHLVGISRNLSLEYRVISQCRMYYLKCYKEECNG